MNPTIIPQIIFAVVGSGTASVCGFYIAAPHLLGIYSDVEIYAHTDTLTIDNTSAHTPTTSAPTLEKNPKNFTCYVTGVTDIQKQFECSVHSITTTTPPKKYVNLNGSATKLEDISKINAGTPPNTNYYKITVSQQLLWELQQTTSTTLSVDVKQKDNKTPKTLQPFLYSYHNKVQPIKTTDDDVKYLIGKAEKLTSTTSPDANSAPTTEVTEITSSSNNGYECSYWKDEPMEACSIYDLESTSTDVTELTDIKEFTKNTAVSANIKPGHYYLIKGDKLINQFFVQAKSDTKPTSMLKMTQLAEAFIFKKGSDTTLFHN